MDSTLIDCNTEGKERRYFSFADKLTFLVPSLIGLLLFITPIAWEGGFTIPVGFLANWLQRALTTYLADLVTACIIFSFAASVYFSLLVPQAQTGQQTGVCRRLFQINGWWLAIRGLAALLVCLTYWQVGSEAIFSEKTGGMLLHSLLPTILCMFFIAGFLLPLLLDFGLLEFVGVLASKVMRPIFTLPGRASVDCLASWLGDGSIGILLTNLQYLEGHYTAREAAVIGTTFSFVSLSFCIVILAQLQLLSYTLPFYGTVILVGIVCAIILPRIPPLAWKKDTYCVRRPVDGLQNPTVSSTPWQAASHCALVKASQHQGLKPFLKGGVINVVEMWAGVLPVVMVFGTTALLLAEFTPIFTWLGRPLVPLLHLLRLPDAEQMAQAVVIGFADMFLPAVIASSMPLEISRFVVACLSVSQLIFMSEIGGLLLGSKIPVSFKDLLLIFVLRTLIALPIIAFIAHLVFPGQ